MIEIKYTNTIEEIKKGFISIHNKYMIKRTILFSVVYLIAAVLGIDFIIKAPQSFPGYALTALGVAMLISQWARPYMVRRRLVKTLMGFYEENYIAHFYDDRIEIETELVNNENAETEIVAISRHGVETVTNPDIIDEKVDLPLEGEKPETSVINLATEELYSKEDEEMFCLFVNRALVYVFPKRCMTDEQIKKLHDYFYDKAI